MNWYVTPHTRSRVALDKLPVLPYARFHREAAELLENDRFHCAHYFGTPDRQGITIYCIQLNDESAKAWIYSWQYGYYAHEEYPSLSAIHPAPHPFERAITEQFGVKFKDHPYDKPLRFAHDRWNRRAGLKEYSFYQIDSPALHQVNVGPIHAGIIEPGAFRFICNGEIILHMEVVLGFQHRGIERLFGATSNWLRQAALSEIIAGDSALSHAWAYAAVIEKLTGKAAPDRLERERTMAQELERIAMHIGDLSGLCTDIGYQLGQVACEALRTISINTIQSWYGNRFGKSLIRPGGTYYPLESAAGTRIADHLKEIRRRLTEVCEDLFSTPSVLGRFEECGKVSRAQMMKIGAVGLAARASGVPRDIRQSHPYGAFDGFEAVILDTGDVMARARMRYLEALQSIERILHLLRDNDSQELPHPDYTTPLPPDFLCFALVEGWRGEICHADLTDARGILAHYRVKDPSLHNWYALSLAVREAEISDFPVNNKSFNLSYCGHDL
ncbi:MAG: NADH dehydrogenase subunit [Rikenellaceae bacterium]|nr:NADH dehydrogenase subunit [Rikenellaceae bacterium]